MAKLDTYLFFDGTCAEAMRFYEKVLGGKLEAMMKVGQAPIDGEKARDPDKIIHAHLLLDGRAILASDWLAPTPFPGNHGFSVSLSCKTVEQVHRVWDALGQGGTITMPLEKTFWTEAFGMLVDRFGIPWMIGVES
jgi:PhnB protein